jgi:hypothetical protein
MSLPDIDWSSDYERGYEAALLNLLEHFETEHYKAAPEDPYYAYYIKHVIDIIRKKINPLIDYNDEQA